MVSTAGFSNFELQQLQNAQNNGTLVSTVKTSEDSSIFADNKVTTNPSDEVQLSTNNQEPEMKTLEAKEEKGLFSNGLLGIIPNLVGGLIDIITGLLDKLKEFLVGKDEEEGVEETPAEDVPADEVPAEEAPSDAVPAEEAPAEEAPADEVPADEAPAEEAPADEAPADGDSDGDGQTIIIDGDGNTIIINNN